MLVSVFLPFDDSGRLAVRPLVCLLNLQNEIIHKKVKYNI